MKIPGTKKRLRSNHVRKIYQLYFKICPQKMPSMQKCLNWAKLKKNIVWIFSTLFCSRAEAAKKHLDLAREEEYKKRLGECGVRK